MSKKIDSQWRNRIIGHGEENPEQLLANPKNFRIHPKAQQDALLGVIKQVGIIDEIIVNQASGFVVNGHLRAAMAISEHQATVPVKYVDLTEEEEALILATFDPLSAMAATDKQQLDALLREVSSEDAAVQAMLGKLAADEGLYKFDPNAEWEGMPEFEQEDLTGFQAIHVHFKAKEDRDTFATLIGQTIGDKTRSIWYPEAEKIDMTDIYVSEP